MTFKIGERVVHPRHGVGHVARLEEREFERGVIRQYYEISIPGGSTVWVPVSLPASGLRRLAQRNELILCRKILGAHPLSLIEDGHLRQSELVERLRQGTIVVHCEVVRDLSAFIAHKPIHGPMAAFLEAIKVVLCQEWAIVEETSLLEATYEIDSLLEKSRLALLEQKTS